MIRSLKLKMTKTSSSETFSSRETHIFPKTQILVCLDEEVLMNFSLVKVHTVDGNDGASPRY